MYDWVIVGAGTAGIAALGKLLDEGNDPQKICWIDPEFNAGDLGKSWYKVSSNTKVSLFTDYFKTFKAFEYDQNSDSMSQLDSEKTCELSYAANTLKATTQKLIEKVQTIKGFVTQLKSGANCTWQIIGKDIDVHTQKVILAVGSEPNALPYSTPVLPMETALNPDKLSSLDLQDKNIAIFGSSHSAVIVVQSLLKLNANVFNFYRSPTAYALPMSNENGNWVLHDNTGLKGQTAEWAKANLYHHSTPKLKRYYSNPENIDEFLPQCDFAIYATGFTKRHIKIDDLTNHTYNAHNGIIAPGVYGIGIAYPEEVKDPYGHTEYNVGMYKFIKYLNRIFPIWEAYPN